MISFKSCAKAGLAALAAAVMLSVSGCTSIREYWQYYVWRDTSPREATGYYQHAEAEVVPDRLQVPEGLDNPVTDPLMEIPPLPPQAAAGRVGEDLDVRAPVAPLRSDLGLRSAWSGGEAYVWFEPNGAHGITDEDQAWMLLGKVLQRLNVGVGKLTPDAYEVTTASADYNEYGGPYTAQDSVTGALRYNQIYRLRVGRNAAGNLGIATQLIGSMTMLSGGHLIEDLLGPIELERFGMGFSNHIIRELEQEAAASQTVEATYEITLGQDDNGHEAIFVSAPYEMTWEKVRAMLPKYGAEIKEYSVTQGTVKFEVEDEDPEFWQERGVNSFNLEEGSYVIRVGLEKGKSGITFYDKDDKPLQPAQVDRIYPGFSQALSKEFALF